MPGLPAVEDSEDYYLCTSVLLPDPEETVNAVGFIPHAHKSNVHHLTLYACSDPQGRSWRRARQLTGSVTRSGDLLHFRQLLFCPNCPEF